MSSEEFYKQMNDIKQQYKHDEECWHIKSDQLLMEFIRSRFADDTVIMKAIDEYDEGTIIHWWYA